MNLAIKSPHLDPVRSLCSYNPVASRHPARPDRLSVRTRPVSSFGKPHLITKQPRSMSLVARSGPEGEPDPFAGAMPKKDIQADEFLKIHPEWDGRGVVVAVFDTGVDPGAAALQETPDGRPKIIDVIDCTGSGDVDTSTKISRADDLSSYESSVARGKRIKAPRGNWLTLSNKWDNPSGSWHVGTKSLFELIPKALTATLRSDRKRVWMEEHRDLLAAAITEEAAFKREKKPDMSDETLIKERKQEGLELEARIELLNSLADKAEDVGPFIDAVVWQDSDNTWWAALDTSELEGGVQLADFEPMTDYATNRQYACFSPTAACNFAVNIYDEGDILSIVVDTGSHGTHVAGIVAAYDKYHPELSGVAPGAQIVSCKVGDTRLGSMETSPGLYRALAAAVRHKVDIINMSYGESTATPDAGRFVELVNEVVNEQGIVFVASAGNSGPGLASVGAPGGTSSAILSIGAWVSPETAAAGHAVREPLLEGQQYNWSSRGPSPNGDTGVTLCAPGGAIAPVPQWTRQRRQLMNGTSMASPCAAGGIALILSGAKRKKDGLSITPAALRRALIATCYRSAWDAESVAAQGAGLLQVLDAMEEVLKSRSLAANLPWRVDVHRQDGVPPATPQHGILLRSPEETNKPTTWAVTAGPVFAPEDISDRLDLEVRVQLSCDNNTSRSSSSSVIKFPSHVLFCASGRGFEIEVDPRGLEPGAHRFELVAQELSRVDDGQQNGAGHSSVLFAVPITVLVPLQLAAESCSAETAIVEVDGEEENMMTEIELLNCSFKEKLLLTAGMEQRRFLAVPAGATWAEIRLRVSADTPKTLLLRATQLRPQARFDDGQWRRGVTVPAGEQQLVQGAFSVEPSTPLELTVSQMWNSLGGCVATVELALHGVELLAERGIEESGGGGRILLDGAAGIARLSVRAPLRSERLDPKAALSTLFIPLRPTNAELASLSAFRDGFTRNRVTHQLTLTYSLTLAEAATVTPKLPRFNRLVYDGVLDGQMLVVCDANKKILGWSDIYPEQIKLRAGTFTIRLALRHTDASVLDKLKDMAIIVERKLESAISLNLYSTRAEAALESGQALTKEVQLSHGEAKTLFLAPPAEDKLPKDATAGRLLRGKIRLGAVKGIQSDNNGDASYVLLEYIVPPPKSEKKEGNNSSNGEATSTEIEERLELSLRDAKANFLKSLKDSNETERRAYDDHWDDIIRRHPRDLVLLTEHLERVKNRDESFETRLTADDIINTIDQTALAVYMAQKTPEEGRQKEKRKKEFDQQLDALIKAWTCKAELAIGEAEEEKRREGMPTLVSGTRKKGIEDAFVELEKWVDPSKDNKFASLQARRLALLGRYALAVKTLDKALEDDKVSDKHKELAQKRLEMLEELKYNCWVRLARSSFWISYPVSYPLV